MVENRDELRERACEARAESRELMDQYRTAVNLVSQMMVALRSNVEAFQEMKAGCRQRAFRPH